VKKPSDDWDEPKTLVQELPLPASVRARTKKPFLLEQIAGPGAPCEHKLEQDEIVIGRSAQAGIFIDGNGVSRSHLSIRRSGPEYGFTDLNSANGVYLNSVKTHSAVLREGDVIQIGDVVFVFHEGA
jgi:pSer/pThr/pTyr-binding forkhead associated (FHA) protein